MTKIQIRRDTNANWQQYNPVPAQGEPCYETDTGKLKIGNGEQTYTSLPYQGGGVDNYTELQNLPQINGVELKGNLTSEELNISAPTNMVTTDTTQSISGEKTFTSEYTKFEQASSRGVGLAIKTSTNSNAAYIVPIRKDGTIPILNKENFILLGARQNGEGIQLNAGNEYLTIDGNGINANIINRQFQFTTNYERFSGAGNGADSRSFTIHHSQAFRNGVEYQGVFFANDPGYSSFKVGDFNNTTVSNNEFVHIFDNPTEGTMGVSFNTLTKKTVIKTPKDNLTIARGTTYQEYNNVDSGNIGDYVPTGQLKYWTGTEANYTAIEAKNADTLYKLTDTNKVYLGTIPLAGGSSINNQFNPISDNGYTTTENIIIE